MPYAQPFVKVNAEGHFGSSTVDVKERWQAGFHITKNGGVIGGTTELTTFLTAIRAPLVTYHTDLNVASGTTCYIDAVSGAYIDVDGNYALGALQSTTRVAVGTPNPGQGSTAMPWSSALVITLRSLLTRGPASHGRIYWPRTGLGVDATTGLLTSTKPPLIATAAQTMLNAVNVQAAAVWGSNAGVGLVSNQGLGFQSPVTRVLIGAKMDSMESRERDLLESYSSANLTVSTALLEQLDEDFKDAFEELVEGRNK